YSTEARDGAQRMSRFSPFYPTSYPITDIGLKPFLAIDCRWKHPQQADGMKAEIIINIFLCGQTTFAFIF
ncbi:MAG: hypothetical protein WBQ62_07425, partial [Dehalococcoidales bacterium]